jgi:hypothetical protein
MHIKNLLTAALLLFVTAAAVTIALKNSRDSSTETVAADTETNRETPLPTDGLVVYFFHSETRCPTCRKIEAYAHEAIDDAFQAELASGEIVWQLANYEAPENAQAARNYEVYSSSVVLVRSQQSQPADWRNLTRVWELVGDKDAFKSYVRGQTQEMLSTASG